jgi:acetylornithine/succinyldiaminopimelate/putrescine aminotransferase
MLEPIQGEGGVVPADPGYLRAVQELCRERGLIFMMDEVQTGFCRTGRWFGFEHAGVSPDVVTFAKGMGNGMPVGAVWARRDVAAVMKPGDHGSTYSGTAIATAAVNAVIDEMKRIDACALATGAGARVRGQLLGVPGVDHIRGEGLLLGVALSGERDANAAASELLSRGLIVNAVNASTLRLAPPLTVSDAEIDEACALIAAVLA